MKNLLQRYVPDEVRVGVRLESTVVVGIDGLTCMHVLSCTSTNTCLTRMMYCVRGERGVCVRDELEECADEP